MNLMTIDRQSVNYSELPVEEKLFNRIEEKWLLNSRLKSFKKASFCTGLGQTGDDLLKEKAT